MAVLAVLARYVIRIISVCLVCLIIPPTFARVQRGSAPSSAPSGNINLSLSTPVYYSNVFPFTNILKTSSQRQVTNSAAPGVTYSSGAPQGTTDIFGNVSAYGTGLYLDNNADLLSSLPAGNICLNTSPFIFAGGGPPGYVGQPMTLDWQGGSSHWTVTVSGGIASGTGTTPLSFNWPTGNGNISITVCSDGTNATPPTKLRLYKTANASSLNAGLPCDPDFVSDGAATSWDIRFMDWMDTNGNTISTSVSNFPATDAALWGAYSVGGQAMGNLIQGVPVSVITGCSAQMNKNPSINIPEGFVTPKMSPIRSISNAATPVITTFGPHSFITGDTVYVGTLAPFAGAFLTNPSSYASSTFTATGSNILSNNAPVVFGILANGSTDSSTYPTGIVKGTTYWTVNANTGSGTYQISSTAGGSALTLTGSMSGTINVLQNNGTGSTYGQLVIGSSYAASTFTIPSGTPINANGTPIVFGAPETAPLNPCCDTSTYPSPINKGTTYYAVNVTATTFKVATTPGGSALTLTGSQTGPINIFLDLSGVAFTVGTTTSNSFTITGPGANTAGYVGKSDALYGIGVVMAPFSVTATNSNVGGLVSAVNGALASNLTAIYTWSNERWNNQFSAAYLDRTMAQNVTAFLTGGQLFADGYMMAAVANAVRIAYGVPGTPANRSKYKFLFEGNQTSNDLLSGPSGVIAGVNQYITDNAPTLVMTDLFDFLTMTTYQGSVSYGPNGAPGTPGSTKPVAFGTNTVAFTGAVAGLPIKLNTDAPGGTLPTGLVAGTLGAAGSGAIGTGAPVGTISGNVLTVNYLSTMVPNGTVAAGATIVSSNPDQISVGTIIKPFGSGGTTGTGGAGTTYQLSASQSTLSTPTQMFTGPAFVPGTGTIYWTVGAGPNFGLATTPGGSAITFSGGSGSNTVIGCPADVVQFLLATSLSNHASNPATYPAPWTYFDQSISDDIYNAKWTGGYAPLSEPLDFTVLWNAGRASYFNTNYLSVGMPLAGLGLFSYEGGESNNPTSGGGGFPMFTDPTWMSGWYETQFGAGSATNFSQMYTALVTSGLMAHLAQFQDAGAFFIVPDRGNFSDQQYIGDHNARWQGVKTINQLNFLLKRDLDPASNDNAPMWLEKAA